jgi:hypothetical protein
MSDPQKQLFNNIMNIFTSMSFYSPLIILTSVFVFSMFTGTIVKFAWYLLWCFVLTCLRWIIFKPTTSALNTICNTFIPNDYTYSTYILTFTMIYFVFPMIMTTKQHNFNTMNYGVIALFTAYIALDLFIKKSYQCISGFFTSLVLTNAISGLFLGVCISLMMYSTQLKTYLYMNEINSNKEVCSMPSKQTFRCNLYKNGELVGSSST